MATPIGITANVSNKNVPIFFKLLSDHLLPRMVSNDFENANNVTDIAVAAESKLCQGCSERTYKE